MPKTNLVRPSRDGDQFHYLWAARRCLHLLSFQGDLLAISIEGPSPRERKEEPPESAGEQVIDIAEYFGSEEFENARLIRYLQLKHSTLHAQEHWTASGLEKTIKGFASRYKELLKAYSVDTLAKKLEFCFVTNRPIAKNFSQAVADSGAEKPTRYPNELKKLERFTGLSGDALNSFSKLLHFEDRQDDYWNQRHILFQDVQGYLPDADVDGPLKLKELVTRKALSEGEKNPTITKMDVLRALDTDESMLFPAPCLIKPLDLPVPREQWPDLIREIISAKKPVVLHASAGVGKTVLATQITYSLPVGSKCILYDCFGHGQYRNASSYRHRHKDALVQIANELAAKALCHLLIPTTHADASAYMRAFINRISQAANQLWYTNPNALLCIVVDAADNAQMAAEEIGESRSFVRDLIRETIPSNVRLVFFCRSHRQDYLDPPVEAAAFKIEPFSREETATHLRQWFPEANEYDIDEFHRLSSHNPRVQALSLSRNDTLPDKLRLLGPNPTTVEDTIGSLLEGAISKLKDNVGSIEKDQIDKICAGLAALRPLIPIPILSKISGVDKEEIRSFAIDLDRPLLVAGDTIQFFDEPAETWFREKYKPAAETMEKFIKNIEPIAKTSAYVASVLPQLLLEAGNFLELVKLALNSTALPETSPLEKRDVEIQRLQFALKASLRSKRYLDAAKLTLKAGVETAGDNRQRKILQTNTDLAATFLGTELIQEIVSRRIFGSGWLGSHHAYEAAMLSVRPELVGDARSRLRMAYEWLQNWSRLTEDEQRKEVISDQDIAELTLSHVNVHNPADGAYSLGEWQPREVSFRVGRLVARRLIDHGRLQDVEDFACADSNNYYLALAVTVELRDIHRTLPSKVTRDTFRSISKKHVNLEGGTAWGKRGSTLNSVTALVEAALQHGVCATGEAAAVLSKYLPDTPPRSLSSEFSEERFPMLRAYCLRAALLGQVLELRDLAYEELQAAIDEKSEQPMSRDIQEFKGDIGALLPWHQLWVETILGRVTKESIEDEINQVRKASKEAARVNYYHDSFHTSNQIAMLWLDILFKLDSVNEKAMSTFLHWKEGLKSPLFTPTLTALARLCGQRETAKSAAIEFALESFKLIKSERSEADSKSEGFIEAARAILSVSKADSAAFFNEAVLVASKIGDENLLRWSSILDLAERAAKIDRPSPEMAYHFARCAELTYDYVARDKHFNWQSTIEVLCDLCPSSAITILSRWRDRGFGWHERILPVAIDRLIANGSLDAMDALPLISFRARWTYHRLLDSALNSCATQKGKQSATTYLFNYMRYAEKGFAKVKEVSSKHRTEIAGLDEIISFEERRKEVSRNSSYKTVDEELGTRSRPKRNWDDVFDGCELTSADGLSRAYAAFKKMEPPWGHDQFFKETIQRIPVGSEAAFIDAIGTTPGFDLYHLRSILELLPGRWKGRPAIIHTLADNLKAFCRRYCMHVKKDRYYEVLPFKEACATAEIGESDLAEVVLDAVGETPDIADYDRLFSLTSMIVIQLSEDEALKALEYGLNLYRPVLEEKDGDGPWSTEFLPPTDIKASLAGYIWAAMAAPEGVLRWEGSHVVLGLAALGRQDVLCHMVKFATEMKSTPFVDVRLHFYGLHALQWFLIGIARAAIEFPSEIAPFDHQIVDWAMREQSHALIRQFAARAALTLLDSGILEDKDRLKARLGCVNVSPFPKVKSQTSKRIRPKNKKSLMGDDRYYFGIDIGPYWYAPLGRVFALTQDQIEAKALKVIRSDLGFQAKGRWDEDERGRRRLYEENHTRHSHGSYPRADTLHFYHAYHAMMIVAGNLLDSTPMINDLTYSKEDRFAEWIDRHELSRKDGRWLWDRRDPTPMLDYSWENRNNDLDWSILSMDDFDEALHDGRMLNIWGDWTTSDSKHEQSVQIYTALVSPDKSLALLRALGTTVDQHLFALPSAESDMEIKESGFALKGWVVDHIRGGRLEGQDRWGGCISFPPPTPARFIIDMMNLEADSDLRLWKDKDCSVVLESQTWGHYDEALRHVDTNPEQGRRLQASFEFLLEMLEKIGSEMIIEVQIDRKIKYQPYERGGEDDKERIPPKPGLYILRADGRFITL